MKKRISSCFAVWVFAYTFALAQPTLPFITFNGQTALEKTYCFQLAPLESSANFDLPQEAGLVYIKINWTGGSSTLQASVLTNDMRRPKSRWEGISPVEHFIQMGSLPEYIKIQNPSSTLPAYGCCVVYYTLKQKIKNDLVFEGNHLQTDTGKITYATLLNLDKSSWGNGTLALMPDGKAGILYPNGNYIKGLGDVTFYLVAGDSVYNVKPNIDLSAISAPFADPPHLPSSFANEKDQKWLNDLTAWIVFSNEGLNKTAKSFVSKTGLATESKFNELLAGAAKNGIFTAHQFLIGAISAAIYQSEQVTSINKQK